MPRATTFPNLTERTPRHIALVASLLFAGLLLRLYFVRWQPFIAGDSILYQDIAQNWIHAHIYGLSTDAAPRPTLIRLPGYPTVLATLGLLFDRLLKADTASLRSFLPVLWLQLLADLATCCVVARIARRLFGPRAGLVALALACVCPFTANYVAVPLTETFVLFLIALAFDCFLAWRDDPTTARLVMVALTTSASVLMRPDQGLLAAVVLLAVYFSRRRLAPVILCAVLAASPFAAWTVRNYRTFHVVQPLAPRLANDPGEAAPTGFQRWFRTWAVDFTATQDAYWKYPEETVLIEDLPGRAFDCAAQRAQTAALLQQAATTHKLEPQVEAGFLALAAERVAAHPVRYYIGLPLARLANMLLHPRDEMLPVAERWWQYRQHPRQTLFAYGYAALNLALLVAACAGLPAAWRADRSLTVAMLGYIVLRCALLLTLDNAEQRYTLEFFPIVFVWASALGRREA